MKTFLAWRNLIHNRIRTAVAATGVTFAVVLVFMQLGFLGAVQTTATLSYESLDFDVCLRSPQYLHFAQPRTFPASRIRQAASLPGIVSVHPLHVAIGVWRNPQQGERRGMLLLGVPYGPAIYRRLDIQKSIDTSLANTQDVLVDSMTRREFGPRNGREFGDADVGVETEISQRRVRINGHFQLGTGFAASGAVMLNEPGFHRVAPGYPVNHASLGLIRVDKQATTVEQVIAQLRATLPGDVEVLSREEVLQRELFRWVRRTSFGLIFELGVGIALFVGTAIVYQVLSSEIVNLMPEYATLKAMGYGNGYLTRVILQQATFLALLGFIPGWICSNGLYAITTVGTRIPISMTTRTCIMVLVLTIVMCIVSGLAALRKVFKADPASLF